MNKIAKFTTKQGRVVEIVEPTMDLLNEILEFANRLAEEDSFLNFDPAKKITLEEERKWLENNLKNVKNNYASMAWAVYDNRIVGAVDIRRSDSIRSRHVGTVGLMVDKDFRREGIGHFLLNWILKISKKMGIKIAILDVFSDNEAGRALYQKFGFKEWGRLPNGVYRRNKFSDKIEMYKEIQPSFAKATEDK